MAGNRMYLYFTSNPVMTICEFNVNNSYCIEFNIICLRTLILRLLLFVCYQMTLCYLAIYGYSDYWDYIIYLKNFNITSYPLEVTLYVKHYLFIHSVSGLLQLEYHGYPE